MLGRLAVAVTLVTTVTIAGVGSAVAEPSTRGPTCAPGQIIAVRVTATPAHVKAGQPVSITAQGLNCTSQTQSVSEVDRVSRPSRCATTSSAPSPDTFAPNQLVRNTFPVTTVDCPGPWSFAVILDQGAIQAGFGSATWTVHK